LAAEKNNSIDVVDDSGDSVGYAEYEPSKKSIIMPIFGRRLKKVEKAQDIPPSNPPAPPECGSSPIVPKKRPGRPKGSGKKQGSIVTQTKAVTPVAKLVNSNSTKRGADKPTKSSAKVTLYSSFSFSNEIILQKFL